jgi:hypothetical protein
MWKIAIDRRGLLGVALGAALLSAAPISLHWSPTTVPSLSVDRAHARVGQPLSPGSVAGVNRRVNRRTARRGYYSGAAAAGAAATSSSNGGNNNLYSYAPAANVTPAANTAPTNASAAASTTESNSTLPAGSPELYASCLIRTYGYGSCP